MGILQSIPEHITCINCGRCCGLVPVSPADSVAIKNYISQNNVVIGGAADADPLKCPFWHSTNKRCEIYPVRPLICRLMGVSKQVRCPNGNSANIDGRKYSHLLSRDIELMSNVDWR